MGQQLELTVIPEWVSKDAVAAGEFLGRLGRHVEHDVRSLLYVVDHGLSLGTPIVTKVWTRFSPILDQGELGSCTGNAMAGWLGCAPHVTNVATAGRYDESVAVQLYEYATQLDNFPGSYPPDDTGSSGLAVAKAAKKLGYISRYGHAISVKATQRALMHGPVIMGMNWYDSFDKPGENGVIDLPPNASVRGGHEVLVRGWDAEAQQFVLDNSWGVNWGDGGSFRMPLAVFERLRAERADVTVPMV